METLKNLSDETLMVRHANASTSVKWVKDEQYKESIEMLMNDIECIFAERQISCEKIGRSEISGFKYRYDKNGKVVALICGYYQKPNDLI